MTRRCTAHRLHISAVTCLLALLLRLVVVLLLQTPQQQRRFDWSANPTTTRWYRRASCFPMAPCSARPSPLRTYLFNNGN